MANKNGCAKPYPKHTTCFMGSCEYIQKIRRENPVNQYAERFSSLPDGLYKLAVNQGESDWFKNWDKGMSYMWKGR